MSVRSILTLCSWLLDSLTPWPSRCEIFASCFAQQRRSTMSFDVFCHCRFVDLKSCAVNQAMARCIFHGAHWWRHQARTQDIGEKPPHKNLHHCCRWHGIVTYHYISYCPMISPCYLKLSISQYLIWHYDINYVRVCNVCICLPLVRQDCIFSYHFQNLQMNLLTLLFWVFFLSFLSFLSLYHCVISYSLQVVEIESRLGSGSLKQLSRASFLYIYRICLLRL